MCRRWTAVQTPVDDKGRATRSATEGADRHAADQYVNTTCGYVAARFDRQHITRYPSGRNRRGQRTCVEVQAIGIAHRSRSINDRRWSIFGVGHCPARQSNRGRRTQFHQPSPLHKLAEGQIRFNLANFKLEVPISTQERVPGSICAGRDISSS